jgi:hypothetical protein
MKKITINFIIVALFLSIGVQAAPMAHNNKVITQVERDEAHPVKTAFIISGTALIVSGILIAMGSGGVATGLSLRSNKIEKKHLARRKKKAKAALRKRAEAEYAHRHMPHKWKML